MRARWPAAGLVLALLAVAPAPARECGPLHVEPERISQDDASRVCEAGALAEQFLASIGIGPAAPVMVRVEEELPAYHGVQTYGTFDAPQRRVSVLSLSASMAVTDGERPFGLAMDERLHTSFLVHELTHALIHEAFAPGCASRRAHEYIAYVAQFSTMAPELRAEILRNYPTSAFADREISEIYYALDPHAFAVKSWLHFNLPGNGAGFVQRALNGALRPALGPR